jgi:hypothetical protein
MRRLGRTAGLIYDARAHRYREPAMSKFLACLVFALIFPVAASAQIARELIGKYQMEVQGGDILELRADGTAVLAGDSMTWSVRGRQLVVGSDVMPYQIQGDRLLLTMGSVQLAWKKVGGAALTPMQSAAAKLQGRQPPPEAAPPEVPAPPAAGHPQDVQARQLLTSTAWCSFTYNKVSGTSTTRRVVFRPDGVMLINGGAETYSSGYGGTHAGQSSNAGAMRWRLDNQRLYVDPGDGTGFQDVNLTASRNSSGYVILQSLGREYSMCN